MSNASNGRPGGAGLRPASRSEPKGWYSRGYLPHFDVPDLIQAVTFRLADSLPKSALDRLDANGIDAAGRRDLIEATIDCGLGECLLGAEQNAQIVQRSLLHFDGERYRLLAWVVMPNHLHVLLETFPRFPLADVIRSWKTFTARGINLLRGRQGAVWQPDYFDRYIRDQAHFEAAVRYIEQNPVKAGLVGSPAQWPFGSAAMRAGGPRPQDDQLVS